MECAFLSRARCWRIESDFPSWKKWAINKGVNPTIIAYLGTAQNHLHDMDAEALASVFPCPRSWTSLSKKLNDREKRNNGKPLDQDAVDIYAASCVGSEVSAYFGAFYAYNSSVISVEDILANKASTDIGTMEPEVMYIIVQNLVRSLTSVLKLGQVSYGKYKPEAVQQVANACNWLVGIGAHKLDLAITAITDLSENVDEFADLIIQDEQFDALSPNFVQFALDNEIVFGAH